jgi:hypothetical protein
METVRRSRPSLWFMLALGLVCLGADKPPETVSLFDGKSLEGWKASDFYKPGEVKVRDGSIMLSQSESMTGVTSTRKDLPKVDYELTYEAMRTDGEDFFAAATFPVKDAYISFINGGWGGHVTGLSSLDGADASENETTSSITYKNKTWYRFRIRVTSDVIRCWVDDKPTVEVNIRERQISTRLEVRANQPLGFATYETGGAIRKVEVRKLTPAEVKESNKTDKE